jgi:DNA polymerase-4
VRREPSILHVDLDAMFAAVEQRDKVSLRGKPVIVGGVAGRGVVSTASYEARAYGAHSAMPMAQARRLCPPNTAFLSPRFPAYQKTSKVVMALLAEVSPLVEQVSIDEAYVDLAVTGHDLSLAGVTELAGRLKAEIAVATGGVTGSIGAASSKLLAKIGSDLNKPDGLTIVPAGAELDVLHPLPVRRLGGVGPATEQRLHRAGVRTVGQLAAVPLDDLVDWFGTAHGHGLFHLARAEDNRPVVGEREAKSVSAEETFDVDLTDATRLNRELDLLAARVAGRLGRSGLTGRTVNIKVRHPDFTTVTRAITRDQPTDDGRLIAQLARRLLAELDTSGGVRLLGVGVSTLADFAQDDLFTAAGEDLPVLSIAFPEEDVLLPAGSAEASTPSAPAPVLPVVTPAPSVSPSMAPPDVPSFPAAADSAPPGPPAVPALPAVPVVPAVAPGRAVLSEPLVSPAQPGPAGPAPMVSDSAGQAGPIVPASGPRVPAEGPVWRPGQDVRHEDYGAGWVRGSGVGRVTVRFEGPHTPPGPVRTFFIDDPRLHAADPPDWSEPPLRRT